MGKYGHALAPELAVPLLAEAGGWRLSGKWVGALTLEGKRVGNDPGLSQPDLHLQAPLTHCESLCKKKKKKKKSLFLSCLSFLICEKGVMGSSSQLVVKVHPKDLSLHSTSVFMYYHYYYH